ncbi:hypothetical protein ONS95_007285 [Cadophora gregata]|uniref:uncharacterized protein n=1 Tax=Cadophora gregata TaxID=51156 RepID=UPI0026DDB26A|nr:uncharacterized protein ONS95_007285 [Cadophora gregata]KAK0100838.1 hypothetical protein ONS95_007285 [Cadophora gregata]KAK0117170.1 hypothetical protein ONS96_013003 [Cadophora gregata f. sp. sojae]
MDIQDVSHDAQYAHILLGQKARLEAARARKGERPTDRSSRNALARDHMIQYQQFMALRKSGSKDVQMRASIVGDPYLPSTAPVKNLKKTMIDKLTLENHHRGYYLLLRLFVTPVRLTGIISLAEDEAGDALTFSLYQQENEDVRPAADILEKDSVLLLKEPYFKCVGDGGYGLRVDHPTDIVWLSNDDPLVPSAWKTTKIESAKNGAEWKQKGNDEVKEGKFREAVNSYTAALDASTTSTEAEIIHNNRALAYLRLKQFDAALQDANFIVDHAARSEKALYRGALALYNLSRYQEALELLQILLNKYPASQSGAFELARIKARLREQNTGLYNFKKMYKAAKLRPPLIDCATYIGAVEVRETPGKGRGLFTTQGINAGDLLMCEKAFSYAHAENSSNSDVPTADIGILVNLGTNRLTMGTHVSQLTEIYQKLANNSSMASEFLDLYSDSYKRATEVKVDGAPVVDSFLIERIVSLNVFGSTVTSKDTLQTSSQDSIFGASGLWIKAAYINHTCMKNCARTFIGDMMIVRATKDMPADTELGWCYADPMNREKMQKSLSDSWGFKCNCALCRDDAKTPTKVKAKRKEILASLATSDPRDAAVKLENTYISPVKDIPRFELFQLYSAMAQHFIKNNGSGNQLNASIYALKALEALGFVTVGVDMKTSKSLRSKTGLVVKQWGYAAEELTSCWEILWSVWRVTSPDLAEKAKAYWKLAYMMVRAGESETFDSFYSLEKSEESASDKLIDGLRAMKLKST